LEAEGNPPAEASRLQCPHVAHPESHESTPAGRWEACRFTVHRKRLETLSTEAEWNVVTMRQTARRGVAARGFPA
jgi:hypothetical protein